MTYGLAETIRRHNQLIGAEDIEVFEKIKNRFANSSLYKAINVALDKLFRNMIITKSRPEFSNRTLDKLEEAGYMALTDVTVYVPTHLNVDMGTYVSYLTECNNVVSHNLKDMLTSTNEKLSILLNTPELLDSAGFPTGAPEIKDAGSVIDTIEDNMKDYFDKDHMDDKMRLGDAYPNIKSMREVASAIANLQDDLNRLGIPEIQRQIESVYKIAGQLADEVRNNPDYAVVTDKIQKMISDRLYVLAQYTEMLGFIISQTNILIAAVHDTENKLKSL